MKRCHVCGKDTLVLFPEYSRFKRVTSDTKPWPAGGHLGRCTSCGCVQALVDDAWRKEIAAIYGGYTIYFQADGAEQKIFEPGSGAPAARSDRLVEHIARHSSIPKQGRLLDVGCGNGNFLQSASRMLPGWTFAGVEWDEKYAAKVLAIPRVENHYTGDLGSVPGEFDAISMIHVLEHIESPRQFLEKVKQKLKPGGWLIIELPYYVENPFELFVADHSSHFDCPTIESLLASVGFQIEIIETGWVTKEITLIARNLPGPGVKSNGTAPSVPAMIDWLGAVVKESRSIADKSPRFGLFGTAIASTWLFSELEGRVTFFVDEDPNRIGKEIFGLPIHGPSTVPADSDVYVGLAPKISQQVIRRLQSPTVRYHGVAPLP